ncbi:hypothetical protein ED733_006870 [Metarhizium rileyi]|uniref:SprT-like domain-containing protein n=1 Tax=Metarhizium rileyi (strain RCEF 4871) TaxID=1649241 RepID=A0A5C6GJV9_METRR|nr:hypothetical protein ED733_006870 [Metarhizium rileyi]
MTESTAKLGLVTGFEHDPSPATPGTPRITTLNLTFPTFRRSKVRQQSASSPPATKGRLSETSSADLVQALETHDSSDQTMPRNVRSACDREFSRHELYQEAPAKSSPDSVNNNSIVFDSASSYSHDDNYENSSVSIIDPGSAYGTSLSGVDESVSDHFDNEQSAMSKSHEETKQIWFDGPLKSINGNISTLNRNPCIKRGKKSPHQKKPSTNKFVKPPNGRDLTSLFEKMQIDSRESSAGNTPKQLNHLSHVTMPPISSLKAPGSHHKHRTTPWTVRWPATASPSGEMSVKCWNGDLSRHTQAEYLAKEVREAAKKDRKVDFETKKQSLAESFLSELDLRIANGRIAQLTKSTNGVKIVWTKSLQTTAGRAIWRHETIQTKQPDGSIAEVQRKHHASIELATNVIDDEYRLLNVLAHEFCHLATFIISGVATNPHGKEFKSWAAKCSRILGNRGVQVTTKHNYDIDFKYRWECEICGLEYKRHSRSIDTKRHRCGICKGKLKQVKPVPRASPNKDGGMSSGQSEYQRFVKQQMALVKRGNHGVPQRDILKIIAGKWADAKNADPQTTKKRVLLKTQSGEGGITSEAVVDLTLGDD